MGGCTDLRPLRFDVSELPLLVLSAILRSINDIDDRFFLLHIPTVCRLWKRVCLGMLVSVRLGWAVRRQWNRDRFREISPITIENIAALVRRFGDVHELHIFDQVPTTHGAFDGIRLCAGISPSTIVNFVTEACPRIVSLVVGKSGRCGDDHLQQLATGCPQLQSLVLGGCEEVTDAGIQSIAECCSIGLLNLTECCHITDHGIRELARGCPHLHTLELGTDEETLLCQNTEITDDGIKLLFENCSSLSNLNLGARLQTMTDQSVLQLACRTRNRLRTLSLLDAKELTDGGLRSLALHCPSIISLDLGCCDKVTDRGLAAVASSCQQLTNLNVDENFSITNAGLQKFSRLSTLSSLSLKRAGCLDHTGEVGITPAGLCTTIFSSSWPSLQFVDMSHHSAVSDAVLEALGKRCSQLRTLNLEACEKVCRFSIHSMHHHATHACLFFSDH